MSGIEYVSHPPEHIECITDIGLVLVATDDAFGRLVRAVTKQDYNYIGWYYLSSVTGCQQLYYILVDPYSFTAPEWLCDSDSLEELAKNPLVSRLDLRPIDPCPEMCPQALSELKKKLRLKCVEVINEYRRKYSKCLPDVVKQLFGHRISESGCGLTSLEMVNTVIQRAGLFEKIPQSDKVNDASEYAIHGELKSNAQGLAEFFQILGTPFRTQAVANPNVSNKLLASYVEPNCVFGNKIFRIQLPCHGETEKTKAYIISKHKSAAYMSGLIKTFGELLMADAEFFGTVIAGMNDERQAAEIRNVFLADSIENLGLLIRQLVKKTTVSCQNQDCVNEIICKINHTLVTVSGLLGGCPPQVPGYSNCDGCQSDLAPAPRVETKPQTVPAPRVETPQVVMSSILSELAGSIPESEIRSELPQAPVPVPEVRTEPTPAPVPEVRTEPIVEPAAPKGMLKIRVETLNDEILKKLYSDIKKFNGQEMAGVKAEVTTEMTRRGLALD